MYNVLVRTLVSLNAAVHVHCLVTYLQRTLKLVRSYKLYIAL